MAGDPVVIPDDEWDDVNDVPIDPRKWSERMTEPSHEFMGGVTWNLDEAGGRVIGGCGGSCQDCACNQPSPNRHQNSARFHELLKAAGEMHDRKQADYGKGDDPFANVRASEDWGMPGWVGSMLRLTDKVRRLQALVQNGKLQNESATDSFMDIAVYALIAYVLYEEENAAPLTEVVDYSDLSEGMV